MYLETLTRSVENKMDFSPCRLLDRGKNVKHEVKLKSEVEEEKVPQSEKSLKSFISVYSIVEKPFLLSAPSSICSSNGGGSLLLDEKSLSGSFGPGENRYLELASDDFRSQVQDKLDKERALLADYKTAFPEFSNRYSSDRIARDKLKRQQRGYVEEVFLPNASVDGRELLMNPTTGYQQPSFPGGERQYISSYNNLYYHTTFQSVDEEQKKKKSSLHKRVVGTEKGLSYPTFYCRHPTCEKSFHFASDVVIHEKEHVSDPLFNRKYHPPLKVREEDLMKQRKRSTKK